MVDVDGAIGLDIGGTRVKAALVGAEGRVLRRANLPTDRADLEAVAGTARRALEQLAAPGLPVGVCCPGLAAPDGLSVAHTAGKLPIVGLRWSEALGVARPVPVLNDAHAALLGEAWAGAARGKSDVVMLTLGTGVGGAVLWGGRLMTGRRGLAGSAGHLSLDPDGPPSIYNAPGSLEYRVGDASVPRRSGGRFADTEALVRGHLEGDAGASRVWLRSVRDLAAAVASLVNLFDPELVVLGGGITTAGDALTRPLAAWLERFEYRPGGSRVPVVLAELGGWAGAVGAARKALQ